MCIYMTGTCTAAFLLKKNNKKTTNQTEAKIPAQTVPLMCSCTGGQGSSGGGGGVSSLICCSRQYF